MGKLFIHDQTFEEIDPTAANAKLTVNCPSKSVVTIMSGPNWYAAETDELDKATFTGLTHGIWEISMSNGEQTTKRSINIVTDYEITLDFFSATIDITYPKGSICTCSNETGTYRAPDTSGKWACLVTYAGTWTISITDGYQNKSDTVEISHDGQHITKNIGYFTATINVVYPEGAICSCENEADIYSALDTSGNWSFTVYEPGEWVVTASDNIQTVHKTVVVSDDGQVESVEIVFFASSINITYPAGATCTCFDGTTSLKAPDTSGSWTAIVPRIGTWKVTATDGTNTSTQTAVITEDGQSINVTCAFFISYIDVRYPVGTFKLVLWYIDSYGSKIELSVDTGGTGFCRFVAIQAGEYEIGSFRVPPYVGIEDSASDYTSSKVTITSPGETKSITLRHDTLPKFTYDGVYKIVDDAGNTIGDTYGNWNIMFLTSGVFKVTDLNGANNGIDVFVLGGGGNGGDVITGVYGGYNYSAGGGGGGGGHRKNSYGVKIDANSEYAIVIGGAGGSSSAFDTEASGGSDGEPGRDLSSIQGGGEGGNGGSKGGKGGVNANAAENGKDGSYSFFNTSGVLYGPGGAGGYGYNGELGVQGTMAYGGRDGGGNSAMNATANSGGGGGGACYDGSKTLKAGIGGSGLVIIRNKR